MAAAKDHDLLGALPRLAGHRAAAGETAVLQLADCRIDYQIIRSARRVRSLRLIVDLQKGIRIHVPLRTPRAAIEAMITKRADWVRSRLQHQVRRAQFLTQIYEEDSVVLYLGHRCRLRIAHENRQQGCALQSHRLTVNLPGLAAATAQAQHEAIRLELLLWYKRRALSLFRRRLDFWAARAGVSYARLSLSNAEKRWGSCSARDVIRLNWRLVMAPLAILDYVVVHELCHVRHKNHGPRFHRQLASLLPDYREREKELNRLGAGLILLQGPDQGR